MSFEQYATMGLQAEGSQAGDACGRDPVHSSTVLAAQSAAGNILEGHCCTSRQGPISAITNIHGYW